MIAPEAPTAFMAETSWEDSSVVVAPSTTTIARVLMSDLRSYDVILPDEQDTKQRKQFAVGCRSFCSSNSYHSLWNAEATQCSQTWLEHVAFSLSKITFNLSFTTTKGTVTIFTNHIRAFGCSSWAVVWKECPLARKRLSASRGIAFIPNKQPCSLFG